MSLTQEQIDFFHQNGFVVYGKILEDDEIDTLRREYDAVFSAAAETERFTNLAKTREGDESQHMLQIIQMSERSLEFRRLLYHEKILDLVSSLIGPNLMLFHDQALFKPAHTGGPIFWHQDNGYWKCAPANLVSCWLTLDDVVKENGAMQVICGSHLRPEHHVPTEETDRLLKTDIGGSEPVVVDLPAGGCMLHHCQTLHSTDPNETPNQRRAFAIHFMNPGTKDRNGEVMKVGFSHPMMRMSV